MGHVVHRNSTFYRVSPESLSSVEKRNSRKRVSRGVQGCYGCGVASRVSLGCRARLGVLRRQTRVVTADVRYVLCVVGQTGNDRYTICLQMF